MRLYALTISALLSLTPLAASAKAPVLVELFTSQGCAGCAEANAYAAALASRDDVLPLQFKIEGWNKLGLTGEEIVSIRGLADIYPRRTLTVELYRPSDGRIARFPVICRIDTPTELEYFRNGGVLNYVLRNLARQAV